MAIRDEFGYTKVTMDIGDWDMDATTQINPLHGLSVTEYKTIRNISCIIRPDNDAARIPLTTFTSPNVMGAIGNVSTTTIALTRTFGGAFDSTTYDQTSFNRGELTFEYIAD